MWANPNRSKPPLRLWTLVAVFAIIDVSLGQVPTQGRPSVQFPVAPGQGPPSPRPPLQAPPFQPGQGQFPPFQSGQVPFQGQFPPFQPGQAPFQGRFPPPQPGQAPPFQPQFPPSTRTPPFNPSGSVFPRQLPQVPQLGTLPTIPALPPGFPNGSSFSEQRGHRPIQLSSLANLGSQINIESLTLFRTWDVMADFLSSLAPGSSSDYILSLQPQLVKGIPAFKIMQTLNSDTVNSQILRIIVTQSAGMLPSQQAVIARTLEPQLSDSRVFGLILSSENPWELISFYNPRVIKGHMAAFTGAIQEFMASRQNVLKVKLLPPPLLSITLENLLGNKSLNIQQVRGRGELPSLTLMGITCQQIESLKHDDIVPFMQIFRTQLYANRQGIKNLNFPINIRNCALNAVLSYLANRGDNSMNVLSLLNTDELEDVGGEVLTAVPMTGLENIPAEIRLRILVEIAHVEMFDLLRLLPLAQLKTRANLLLNDLTTLGHGGSLNFQDLIKLGNLFCFADILQANASKQTVHRFLEVKADPGTKTCCLEDASQTHWATLLKQTFGANPSKWTSQDLATIGDMLVALSVEDVKKLSIVEIGRGITPLLENSGLNIPVRQGGRKLPFARACSNLLQKSTGFVESYKALMRKYVYGAELMASFVQKTQRQMNARRVRREVPEYISAHEHRDRATREAEHQHEMYSRESNTKRYKRQVPPAPPRTSPTMSAQFGAPPRTPVRPFLPDVGLGTFPMGRPAVPNQLTTQVSFPQQRLPAIPQQQVSMVSAQQQQLALQQGRPTNPLPLQNMQFQGQPPPGVQPQVAQGRQQGGVTQKQSTTNKEQRVRSLPPTEAEIKLTCLGIKAAGPATVGLEPKDFTAMDPNELRDCIESIGFVDWGELAKRDLLLIYKQRLNLTMDKLTTVNLIELGTLVSGISVAGEASNANGVLSSDSASGPNKFHPFDISAVDLSIPKNLDSVSILGLHISDLDSLKVIGDKFAKDNNLLNPKPGSTQTSTVITVVFALGNIVCGLDETVLKTIFDSVPNLFLEVSPMLGRIHGCSHETLSTLANYAVRETNYGSPETWSVEDVEAIGIVVAGLTPAMLATIQPSSMQGLNAIVAKSLTPSQLETLTFDQFSNLGYEAANAIHRHGSRSLTANQLGALNNVLTVNLDHFKIPVVPLENTAGDSSTGVFEVRSVEGEHHPSKETAANETATKTAEPIADDDSVETILAEPGNDTVIQGHDHDGHHPRNASDSGPSHNESTTTTTTTPPPTKIESSETKGSGGDREFIPSILCVTTFIVVLSR